MRSLIVIGVVSLAILIWHLMTVYRPKSIRQALENNLDDSVPLIYREQETQGFLALVGDKKLFWSEDRRAFLSYSMTPKYWIAMGDPVGDKASFESLLWRFREEADRFGAKIVFYQVGERNLPLYLGLGLVLLKLGQEKR